MSDTENANEVTADTQIVAETAPVEQETAPVQITEEAPEATEAAPKTFTQEELDAIVEKRLAKERRKLAREQEKAPPEQFDDQGNLRKPEEIIAEYEARKSREEADAKYDEREEAALGKYSDFRQVAYNPALPVTDEMALAIRDDESGPEILYWLGSNPRDAARIASLPPIIQVKEIGKIAAQVAANPPSRKTTSAPAPISPITPSGNGKVTYDTTDPRSIQAMSTSEWIEADRRRQIEKLRKAQGA